MLQAAGLPIGYSATAGDQSGDALVGRPGRVQ
jgi:hypothetical protein